MAGIDIDATIAIAQRLFDAPLPQEGRSDLVSLLVGLVGARIPTRVVLDVLRRNPMIDELLNESVVTRAFFEKGLAEGEAKGIAEGEREMAVRMAQQALEGRFSALSDDMIVAIRQASIETLQAVVAHVATESLEELRARLGLAN